MAIIWVGTGRFNAYIGPVQDYIDRVVAADVAAGNTLGLEVGVRDAYDVFIRDSINVGDLGTSGGVLSQANSIIKAAPIMAGARTLAGALVPLVGPAPTNFNFVAGDYNRKTGLVGDRSTKYLNSNRNNNADPQNSKHLAVYKSSGPATSGGLIGNNIVATGASWIFNGGPIVDANDTYRVNSSPSVFLGNFVYPSIGFIGVSRFSSATSQRRYSGVTNSDSSTSQTPAATTIDVLRAADSFSNARLAFYSIGEALDLALLDARVSTLINTFGAAIP
jgi:hypothetical protein